MSTPKFYEIADCRLVLGAMSAALRAQKVLQHSGISGAVIKMTSDRRQSGCLYGLALPCVQLEAAKRTLHDRGISTSAL